MSEVERWVAQRYPTNNWSTAPLIKTLNTYLFITNKLLIRNSIFMYPRTPNTILNNTIKMWKCYFYSKMFFALITNNVKLIFIKKLRIFRNKECKHQTK